MSLNPRRSPRKKGTIDALNEFEIHHLLTGKRTFAQIRWLDGTPKWKLMKEIWAKFGPELLETFIADHPCTRPHAWWVFDSPEPRLLKTGKVQVLAPRLLKDGSVQPVVGEPGHCVSPWSAARFETQCEYLKRLGLLLDAEKDYMLTHDVIAEQIAQSIAVSGDPKHMRARMQK